jgi:hypothetical protein
MVVPVAPERGAKFGGAVAGSIGCTGSAAMAARHAAVASGKSGGVTGPDFYLLEVFRPGGIVLIHAPHSRRLPKLACHPHEFEVEILDRLVSRACPLPSVCLRSDSPPRFVLLHRCRSDNNA